MNMYAIRKPQQETVSKTEIPFFCFIVISIFFFTTPGYQMIAPDVVSSGVNMVSNGWCVVIFSEGLEKLSFAIMKPCVSYSSV